MAGRNGMGPEEKGPLTGRGIGDCRSNKSLGIGRVLGVGAAIGYGYYRYTRSRGRFPKGKPYGLEDVKSQLKTRLAQVKEMIEEA